MFAAEQPQLQALPAYVPEVYRLWQRGVDSYGRIALHGQKYPAPAKFIDKTLVVRETRERVILLDGSAEVANHPKKWKGAPTRLHRRSALHDDRLRPRARRKASSRLWENL